MGRFLSTGRGVATVSVDPTARIRHHAHALAGAVHPRYLFVQLVARLLPPLGSGPLLARLYRLAGADVGARTSILGPLHLLSVERIGGRLLIGSDVTISYGVTISLDDAVTIGDGASVGPFTKIYTGTHDIGPSTRRMRGSVVRRPVTIGAGSWVGVGSVVLPGVTIGAGAVVGAGSVVTKSVPENTHVSGNPAVVQGALPSPDDGARRPDAHDRADQDGRPPAVLSGVVRSLVERHLHELDGVVLDESTVLVGEGAVLDSLGLVRLIVALDDTVRRTYGVALPFGEVPLGEAPSITPFRTLASLVDFVAGFVDTSSGADDVASINPSRTPDAGRRSHRDLRPAKGLLVSDFTIDPLATELRRTHGLDAEVAPYGAVISTLVDAPNGYDFSVVWTRPQSVLPSFQRLLEAGRAGADELERDVDRYAELLVRGLSSCEIAMIPTWTVEPWIGRRGSRDARVGGIGWALALVNARLMGALAEHPDMYVTDSQRWFAAVGEAGYSERGWYLGKIPFGSAVFEHAANDVAELLATVHLAGSCRKLIVLDLDNTLWGGVVGDLGAEGIGLGGHDANGEAFVDFQRALRTLRRRGVLLAIASKNDESIALSAIDQHDEMVLRRDDFVGWRIDWEDKAANIADLVGELNLGLQSVVFIDDNPHERERVREALPEVLVPEWPSDPVDYARALASLSCFDGSEFTEEDAARTEMYATERDRATLRQDVGDLDAWLRDLDIVVKVDPLGGSNVARTTQLLNKTNQMNSATRRLSAAELVSWAQEDGHRVVCVSVSDRLGDAGLTGIIGLQHDDDVVRITDFVLSCRVMGRRVEDAMLRVASEIACEAGATRMEAYFAPTEKNAPCRRFFESSPMTSRDDGVFGVDLIEPLPAPAGVTIVAGRASRE